METHIHYENLAIGDWPWHVIIRLFEQKDWGIEKNEWTEIKHLNRIINKDPWTFDPNRSFQVVL